MLRGVLIGESLRAGADVSEVPLLVTRLRRIAVGSAAPDQPGHWTLLDFEAPEDDAEPLAEALASALAPTGGWYVNFNTAGEAYVVFAGRICRYPRGNAAGRARAQAYGRLAGVPEPQLDWED
ncbi:hypothetical protein [Streptomyces sp. NBC_01465]|uniref:hypothetical protein n=1 Tax=Streptomyces sp. NBC_01465 TaxID=2903878 RepID=UPI002E353503|nr:hypothetical protein [Streptomyces sp. NBC_01465]